jgi:hypothetical protein
MNRYYSSFLVNLLLVELFAFDTRLVTGAAGNEIVYYAAELDMEAAHKALVEIEQYSRDHLRQLSVLVDCNERLSELRNELSNVNSQINYNQQGRAKTDSIDDLGQPGLVDEQDLRATKRRKTTATTTTTSKAASLHLEETMRLRMKNKLVEMIK